MAFSGERGRETCKDMKGLSDTVHVHHKLAEASCGV
jgi:hypothetical protein